MHLQKEATSVKVTVFLKCKIILCQPVSEKNKLQLYVYGYYIFQSITTSAGQETNPDFISSVLKCV